MRAFAVLLTSYLGIAAQVTADEWVLILIISSNSMPAFSLTAAMFR